jgi:dUTP pyrophosphatase
MKLKFIKMYPGVKTPSYATKGAACFDISAYLHVGSCINVVDSEAIETGLQVEVPEGWVMFIFSRSGHGFKDDVRLANCVGVIDSDYRGELKVKLTNDSKKKNFIVNHGDRIAQALLVPVMQFNFEQVDILSETDRGTGGFGSTGV